MKVLRKKSSKKGHDHKPQALNQDECSLLLKQAREKAEIRPVSLTTREPRRGAESYRAV